MSLNSSFESSSAFLCVFICLFLLTRYNETLENMGVNQKKDVSDKYSIYLNKH